MLLGTKAAAYARPRKGRGFGYRRSIPARRRQERNRDAPIALRCREGP
ncbi:unnamed protein product [Linum tenue]|uniref:Uncharacterized protein n=1 Tax=Linum tenue TaxID=586396 RepID=A0AAV0JRI2_9ROSI|nr:unnamed protein product [Linum tenue]CAI0412580.1 unnamed protein product [Linum tenue]